MTHQLRTTIDHDFAQPACKISRLLGAELKHWGLQFPKIEVELFLGVARKEATLALFDQEDTLLETRKKLRLRSTAFGATPPISILSDDGAPYFSSLPAHRSFSKADSGTEAQHSGLTDDCCVDRPRLLSVSLRAKN